MEAAATETEGEEEEEEAGLDGRALDVMVGLRYGAMLAGDVNGGREREMCLCTRAEIGLKARLRWTPLQYRLRQVQESRSPQCNSPLSCLHNSI